VEVSVELVIELVQQSCGPSELFAATLTLRTDRGRLAFEKLRFPEVKPEPASTLS
jgi:hypothetical protein